PHRALNKIKAKTPITHPWRSSSMIKSRNCQCIYSRINIEGLQRLDNSPRIEILQFDMHTIRLLRSSRRLSLVNDLKAHLLHHRQVVVKGAPGLWCDGNWITGEGMI